MQESLLFNKQQTWVEKESGLFDVTIGAYAQLSCKYNKNDIGLYTDDGLAVFKNISGPQAGKK